MTSRLLARGPRSRGLRLALGLLWMLVMCACPPATAQTQAESGDLPGSALEVSLLTIGPGEIYYERFGHNAIVIRDTARGRAVAYNYGIFDFGQEDFFLNFARGHMQYLIAANAYADDLAQYRAEGRSIVEQPLNLAPGQRLALQDFLAWNALPQNATYRYDYFTSNCSTKVRDVLDRALDGAIRRATRDQSRGFTYRMDALRLMAPQPALMLLIDLGLGPFADQRLDLWQESFVPMTFAAAIQRADTGGNVTKPISDPPIVLARSRVTEPPAQPPDLRVPLLVTGLALAGLIVLLGRRHAQRPARILLAGIATLVALVCGLGGCMLLALWGLTDHVSAWRNENLMLLDPLCLLLLPVWITACRRRWQPRRWARNLAWLIAAIGVLELLFKLLPWFVQANLHWILLWLPIHVALASVLSLRRADRVA